MTLKTPANAATLLLMVLAMALTFSCSSDEDILEPPDDALPSSSSDGSGPSGILGACLTVDYRKICMEYTVVGYAESESNIIQSCTLSDGTWLSACPEGYTEREDWTTEIFYEYPPVPIQPPANAISLTVNQWKEGVIATPYGEVWYKLDAVPGYYIWWDDSYEGSGYYSADIRVRAFDASGHELFAEDSGFLQGQLITSTGTIYLKVTSYGEETGTFGIIYGQPSGGVVIPTDATVLTAGQWTDGAITTANGEVWYKFDAAVGGLYYVWWDDSYEGTGAYSLDVKVAAYDGNGNKLFAIGEYNDGEYDSGYEEGQPIVVDNNGPVYLRVTPYSGTGTFGITYAANRTRPVALHGSDEAHAIPLTAGQWKTGRIFSEDDDIYYKFEATANTNYYLWLYDYDYDEYSADVMIFVIDKDGNLIFEEVIDEINMYDPEIIRVPSNGTVYINVIPNTDLGEINSFMIRYNDIDDSEDLFGYGG